MPDSTIPVIDNDATPAELVFFFGNHDEIRKLIRSRGRFLLCAPQYARRIYTALTDGSLGSGDNPGVMKLLSLLLCSATFAVGEAPNPVIDIDRFAILTKEVGQNIPTFITLHGHGYTKVHELGPLLDIKTTKIPFAGKSVK